MVANYCVINFFVQLKNENFYCLLFLHLFYFYIFFNALLQIKLNQLRMTKKEDLFPLDRT